MSDIHQGPLGCRATNLTTFSARVEARRVRSLQPPTAAFSDAERARSRSTRCCRPDRRDVVSRPVWIAQTRTPSSGASRGTHGCLAPTRDPSGSSARRRADLVFGSLGKSANPTPESSMSDPQGVAILAGGTLRPGPSGPHKQGTPPRECPGSKQGPLGSWQQTGTSMGSWTRATR